ncbi:bifunctional metallophosphatase/5'-nucleotidase [Paenibacillus sp. IB182496]|uniref:Bifunctional metallophosphatase/5'-nucleotidase n=1 Tax=Paenibacillus sabuli TaxID=2772509 RepID=A0A927GV06_9BACL|nr:bifunctional UDP-sugar hydrolase/5'-nucleotidase [Paenibacillus sabuli]MBD2848252.1 bifunctional metallophosphatase/5'-nucleotidase [Paenibacillus sabuli]
MEKKPQHAKHVVLLHTNDIHSRLEQAAKISARITEARRTHGSDRLLVLDCGDHMDRMRLETEGSGGRVNIELLNEAGYDAVTFGNNEGLTYSKDELFDAYTAHARFPVVCANMAESESGELPEWVLARLIIERGGLRIGLTGATAQYNDFYRLLGWQVRDPLQSIAAQVGWLRPRVDVVVVLSHLGLPQDERMAAEVAGIDLILGGHTHHLLQEPLRAGGTVICATGKFGEYLGRVEIALRENGEPLITAECVPLGAGEMDPEAAAIISRFRESGERRLSRVVTRLQTPLPARTDRESPLPNLLAAGLRRWTESEIGIVNSGQLLGGLARGEVTAGQLHALCPSPINPCRQRMRGAQLLEALEQSLLPEFADKRLQGFGFRGHVLGSLAVDGMTVVYDPQRAPGSRIVEARIADKPLEPERGYLVGTIDMFTFGAGYPSLKEGSERAYFLPEFIRDVLSRQLADQDEVERCLQPRWQALALN